MQSKTEGWVFYFIWRDSGHWLCQIYQKGMERLKEDINKVYKLPIMTMLRIIYKEMFYCLV
jgi:hypothetical protein